MSEEELKRFQGYKGHVTVYKKYVTYYAHLKGGRLKLVQSEDINGRILFAVVEELMKKCGDKPLPHKRKK